MSTPFLAEVKIVSFNFPPKGYAFCNGQTLPISQNQALFSLLGTDYGGNGQTTFALPNLQGRTPIHAGNGFTQGERAGEENHTLSSSELPSHSHALRVVGGGGNTAIPGGNLLATAPLGLGNVYGPAVSLTPMASEAITAAGGNQPHTNLQPYLAVNFVIALQGIFPARD